MTELMIKPAEAERPGDDLPGDFHARVVGPDLILPGFIASKLKAQGIRTATQLLSLVNGFPSAVAHMLDWSIADTTSAAESLRSQMKGHVDAFFLSAPTKYMPPLGARDPSQLRRRRQHH
jgi:hypothetical protein